MKLDFNTNLYYPRAAQNSDASSVNGQTVRTLAGNARDLISHLSRRTRVAFLVAETYFPLLFSATTLSTRKGGPR